jgi:hypothetical protein
MPAMTSIAITSITAIFITLGTSVLGMLCNVTFSSMLQRLHRLFDRLRLILNNNKSYCVVQEVVLTASAATMVHVDNVVPSIGGTDCESY